MFEAIGLFFAFGALGFWIIVSVLMFIIAAMCYEEGSISESWGGGATIFTGILILFLWIVSGVSPWAFVVSHSWYSIAGYFLGYAAIGFTWSLTKWRMNIKKWAIGKRKFDLEYPEKDGTGFSYPDKNHQRSSRNTYVSKVSVSDNSGTIVFWMVYWPFSMLAYVIGEWIMDILNQLKKLVVKMKGIYAWVEGGYGDE